MIDRKFVAALGHRHWIFDFINISKNPFYKYNLYTGIRTETDLRTPRRLDVFSIDEYIIILIFILDLEPQRISAGPPELIGRTAAVRERIITN